MDDPAFALDMAFPALDFDFSKLDLDVSVLRDSQGSMLSPHTQSRRDSSASGGGSILGLLIPSSDMGGIGYQLPYNDAFQLGNSSMHKTSVVGHLYGNEEEALIEDFDFEFDADGVIRDIDAAERELLRSGSVLPRLSRLGSDSAASGRVRLDHEGLVGLVRGVIDTDGDLIMQMDDEFILPDAESFPSIAGARCVRVDSEDSVVDPTESSSFSAEALLKTRKRKAPKAITEDKRAAITTADLKSWNEEYLQNMDAALRLKQIHRAPALAKKNAYIWVFGKGLGGIGDGIGSSKLPGPLEMFSGDNLVATITGVPAPKRLICASKRPHNNGDDESETRRVRARQELEDQVGRGGDDDGFIPVFEESIGVEAGRDAQSVLEDHAASAMPWNISSSLHSYRNLPGLGSSSAPGHGTIGGRQSSILSGNHGRLTSGSPLIGRGRTDMADLERLDDLEFPANGSENFVDALEQQNLPLTDTQAEEFEIFGPTAAVDTQTAQDNYWIKEALARESLNFLEYVKNTLLEQETDELEDDILMGGAESAKPREVTFETLFPPESNSMMVAAQAFHHVLTLATKNFISVKQEEPYAEIWMSVKGLF